MSFMRKALIAGSCAILLNPTTILTTPQPSISSLIRGSYQNRIRRYSPLQKIFDVFASIHQNGQMYMTKNDLLKAICFYNYSNSEYSQQLQNFNPQYICKFLGKNDKFQVYDYFSLIRFLGYDRKKIQKYYEDNNLSQMNIEQFKQFLKNDVMGDFDKNIKQSLIFQSRQFKPTKQKFNEQIQKIANSLFKNTKHYTLKEYISFRFKLIKELYQFQFLNFPRKFNEKSNTYYIDGVDFARSIIKYIDSNKRKTFMKRIKNQSKFQQVQVTQHQYIGFHLFMQTRFDQLSKFLNQKGALSGKQILHIMNKIVSSHNRVSKDQINILVWLLDTDNSGFIEKKQLLNIIGKLQYYTTGKCGQSSAIQLLKEDLLKIKQKWIRIKQIMEE